MDLRKLKTLIDLVSESGISELEVTEGEGKVRSSEEQARYLRDGELLDLVEKFVHILLQVPGKLRICRRQSGRIRLPESL